MALRETTPPQGSRMKPTPPAHRLPTAPVRQFHPGRSESKSPECETTHPALAPADQDFRRQRAGFPALFLREDFPGRAAIPAASYNERCYNQYLYGGYSSAAERLTVAQDVVGSIPTSRPNPNARNGLSRLLRLGLPKLEA